jgi:hypothetical protein
MIDPFVAAGYFSPSSISVSLIRYSLCIAELQSVLFDIKTVPIRHIFIVDIHCQLGPSVAIRLLLNPHNSTHLTGINIGYCRLPVGPLLCFLSLSTLAAAALVRSVPFCCVGPAVRTVGPIWYHTINP